MTFDELVIKARERLKREYEKKKITVKTEPSGLELTLEALTADEIEQAYNYSERESLQDMYLIYISCEELRALARELRSCGEIKEDVRVCDIFDAFERKELVKKILEISGMSGARLSVIDEGMMLKNS